MSVTFTNTEVFNIDGAMRGMRFPFKGETYTRNGIITESDLKLANKLVKAGFEDNHAHCKFLRQILVSVDIDAPLYFWSEMDTYKVGTTANSESTMHRLLKEADSLSLDCFSYDESAEPYLKSIITMLQIVSTNDKLSEIQKLRTLKQILPTSYKQKRHWTANYEVLRNIYKQRKNHRLEEWSIDFVKWVSSLPYSEFITGEEMLNPEY